MTADLNVARIGANSSIMENAVVHVDSITADNPTVIGENVTIGALFHPPLFNK